MTAIKAGEPYNLRWVSASLEPGAAPATQRVTGTITMDLATTDLGTARRGEPALVQWHIADQDGTILRAVCEPTAHCHLGLREVAEIQASTRAGLQITWGTADNTYALPYKQAQPLDPEITLSAPAYVGYVPDRQYPVTVRVHQKSGAAVIAPGVRWSLEQSSTSLGDQRIFAKSLLTEPGHVYTHTVRVSMGACGSRSLVRVVLNAANSPAETDLSNNRAQVMTQIGPCSAQDGASGGGSGGSGGGGRTITVPNDCIPNPDLTDPRPCTNYDKTLDDW